MDTRAQVAIKTVRVARPALLATLRREIRALRRIAHPGIVRVLDEGVEDAVPWYAMELLQGRTLAEFRDNSVITAGSEDPTVSGANLASDDSSTHTGEAPKPGASAASNMQRRPANPWLAEGLAAISRLCSTLAFLHGSGIVHRDLKPGNILIRADGTPVLTDFGLVSQVWDAAGRQLLDTDESIQGTPAYMAPEQIRGQIGDARIDLYALGSILYELVSGQPPFTGRTAEVLSQHLGATPRPLSQFVEDVAPELETLVSKLLAKDPRVRLGYADDVALALEQIGVARAAVPDELRPPAYLYRSRIVGRSSLIARIRQDLDRCSTDRRGALILLGAESGAGKTTLASEVVRLAASLDIDVVMGTCQSASPLQPFRPLLQAIADRGVSEGTAAAEQLLGARGGVLGAYEPAIDQLARSIGQSSSFDLPPDAARDLVLTTLAGVLARFVDRRPLLLVLDDLQWADELSLKFLRLLADGIGAGVGLIILGTYRLEEAGQDLRALCAQPGVDVITLNPLDENAIGTLTGEMLALDRVPEPLIRFLARASGGNPLFVGEYLRAAVGERLLHRESGSWLVASPTSAAHSAADYERLPLPRSLQELVARRLASVSAGAKALLEAASVIGKAFDLDTLLTIAGLGQADGLDALGELIDRHLLEQTSDSGLAFVHDKIREIEYSRLDASRRRQLHAAAGAALIARWSGTPEFPLYYGPLAHHWTVAGDPARAIDYLEKAGEHALGTSAYVDAIGYLNEAVEMHAREHAIVDDARRARWHFHLGDAYRCHDEFAKSRVHLVTALSLLGWPVPQGKWGLTTGTLKQIGLQIVIRWGLGGRAKPSPELITATAGYMSLLPVSRVSGDPLLPMYATLRALNLADKSGVPALRGVAYGMTQTLLAAVGMPGLAARYDIHVNRAMAGTHDATSQAMVHLFQSVYHLFSAHWPECRQAAEASRQIAERVGLRRIWEEASACLAATYLYRVDPEKGLPVYREISQSARRGADRVQMWVQTATTVLELRRGRMQDAQDAIARTLAIPSDKLEIVDGLVLHATAALFQLYSGKPTDALESADRAMEIFARTPSYISEQIGALIWLQEVYVELWRLRPRDHPDAPKLEAAARRVCKKANSMARQMPFAGSEAWYWLGECEFLSGRARQARRHWERALARAEALDLPFQQARAHLALGRSDEHSEARRRHRDRAAELFASLSLPAPTIASVSDGF